MIGTPELIGAWLSIPSSVTAEATARAGFDYVCIDTQHGAVEYSDTVSMIQAIRLGGWGPDAAKASAYKDGAVMMYDFACRGARRTFLGLFLHELGHAHEVDMDEPTKDKLYAGYRVLVDNDAFIGVEFLVDADTRKLYQKFVFTEFLAELYMIYTACGASLRTSIEDMPEPAREAWRDVYQVFKQTFHGIEYE